MQFLSAGVDVAMHLPLTAGLPGLFSVAGDFLPAAIDFGAAEGWRDYLMSRCLGATCRSRGLCLLRASAALVYYCAEGSLLIAHI